jgi:adenylate cyclase
MSDVFVSYARSTEPQAKEIAQALRSEGFSVWRDDEIPAHKPYAEVIEDRLRSSKAVLVIWSADAVKSQWVRAEADAARELGTLIQATVDGTLPPLPFNQIQCAGIDCSNDGVAGRGWEKLKASVGALVRGERIAVPEAVARLEPGKNAICVLPFVNMSGDAEQEYFSDGISEDITTDLSKISALSVTARNTAFTFKGQAADVCAIARKLRVSHVLEGSVRKAGGRVRISAQLIDGRTGDHVWADRYDRELTDIFAIQDEISHAIVDALKVKLLPDEKRAIEQRGTSSVDAYGLYLLARKYFSLTYFGGGQQEQKIIRICKRAVELDPSYAEAWGLLAWVQSTLFTYSEGSEDGTAAARRALALDPTIAAAHCVIARRLLEEGREREAEESIAEALRLEPEAWEVNREAGRTYYNQNRYSEAVPYLEEALSMVEIDYSAWQMLASAYRTLGDEAGLARAAERMVSHSRRILGEDPGNTEALATNACGIAIQGDVRQFKERIELALLLDPDNMLSRYNFACMAAAFLGDVDMAVDLLGPVFEVGTSSSFVRFAMADPDLAEARKNRQIRKMLAGATKRLRAVPEASPAASAARPRS